MESEYFPGLRTMQIKRPIFQRLVLKLDRLLISYRVIYFIHPSVKKQSKYRCIIYKTRVKVRNRFFIVIVFFEETSETEKGIPAS